MDSMNIKLLKDPNFLMVMLATLVKKAGGEIRFSSEDIENVSTQDLMGIFKDTDSNDFILRILSREDYADYIESDPTPKVTKTTPQRYALYDDEEWEN